MKNALLAYRLIGGNYPALFLIQGGMETKVCDVEWQGDRSSTIELAEVIVKRWNANNDFTILMEKVERANGIQHSGGRVTKDDWGELYDITGRLRTVFPK